MSGQMSVSHASKPLQRYKIFSRFASFLAKKHNYFAFFQSEIMLGLMLPLMLGLTVGLTVGVEGPRNV